MVKVLHIQRDGKYHSIKEVATSVQLTLNSKREYVHGDNSDIIPTDTIKNTVHVLAKFKGVCVILLLRCCLSGWRIHCTIVWGLYLLISSSLYVLALFLHLSPWKKDPFPILKFLALQKISLFKKLTTLFAFLFFCSLFVLFPWFSTQYSIF